MEKLVGNQPRAAALGDFNADGRLDAAVANRDDNTVTVLPGLGNGDFGPGTAPGVGTRPTDVVCADFDGDGRADLATANTGSDDVSVLLSGVTPAPGSPFAVGNNPQALVAADFDGDGRVDLAVANRNDRVSILCNLGGGAFGPRVNHGPFGNQLRSLTAVDVKGDGRMDLAVIDQSAVYTLLNTGSTFTVKPPSPPALFDPTWIAAADFDGDGHADVAVSDRTLSGVGVFRGDGTGSFVPEVLVRTGSLPTYVVCPDVDGDGRADVVAVCPTCRLLLVARNRGGFTFRDDRRTEVYSFVERTLALAVGDLNGDSVLDLLIPAPARTLYVVLGLAR